MSSNVFILLYGYLSKKVTFMNKKASTAALLAVILVAAVSVFILVKGTSMTGMVQKLTVEPTLLRPINDIGLISSPYCSKFCTHSSQCGYSCGICSQYSGTCVDGGTYRRQAAESERTLKQYRICIRGCTNGYSECEVATPSTNVSTCFGRMRDCEDACRLRYYPVEP